MNGTETGGRDALQARIKKLIVKQLKLDMDPASIQSSAPLFGDDPAGLGLDSIDALELAMAIHREYGVKIEAGDERNREIFRTVRSLAAHVAQARA